MPAKKDILGGSEPLDLLNVSTEFEDLGIEFLFNKLEKNSMIEAKFSAKAPKWRVVIPGVNLVGTHEIDSSCCAKGQTNVES